ncbi:unnamed protein product [Peronospora farinosa]|uniref:Reverse transcriptase/retrotransposon-derived protein RNase H-like domain-containing protein n=1 Tax=Peronospora farinosa TaxID=134698 RepID=A0AAV0USI0_9STRA|nr:unnamed protein product [Peronospora farinosa]
MVGCTMYSALDLVDGYYQLLMRASDIPLIAVSTPSGILWECRAEHGRSDIENHIVHLRAVFECMRTNKLFANLSKCIFGAEEKDLRKWLGLANYLHKYSENYADMARPLSNLLEKDVEWCWRAEHEDVFKAVKANLLHAPILALPDPDRPFSVVCDASDFAIGSALLQTYDEVRERVIAFKSRQLKAAEKNYPAHEKELLAMKYYLVKFRSPHLSQRMAGWLSFFAEYNFEVKYKPSKQNALADALSRRPDYELAHVTTFSSSIIDLVRSVYAKDDHCIELLHALGSDEFKDTDIKLSARLYVADPPRTVIPHEEDL